MVTTIIRGRAASPIRPGLIVKRVLVGELPLDTGEIVSEAAITDLFKAYKAELDRVNALRPKEKHIRGMRYSSFYTMFRFAQLKGLVELVRTEEADYYRKTIITAQSTLLRVEKGPRGASRVVASSRRVFKATEVGVVDEVCWADLTNAWKNNIEPGHKLEYIPPTQELEEAKQKVSKVRKRIEETPAGQPTFTPFTWKTTMNPTNLKALIRHLQFLDSLGVSDPEVVKETRILSSKLGDWIINAEDSLDDAKAINNKEAIAKYTKIVSVLERASEVLEDGNINGTIELLQQIT